MNIKILAGLFVLLGLTGMAFACGFGGKMLSEDVELPENMEACRSYDMSNETMSLRFQIHEARVAGDYDLVAQLMKEMDEGRPEDCGLPPLHMGRGRPPQLHEDALEGPIQQLPDDVREELRTAMENGDFDTIKSIEEEYGLWHKGSRGGLIGPPE